MAAVLKRYSANAACSGTTLSAWFLTLMKSLRTRLKECIVIATLVTCGAVHCEYSRVFLKLICIYRVFLETNVTKKLGKWES